MRPEQERGAEIDARSDVYAMGAVLYYLLTGVAPFDVGSVAELILARQSLQILPPSRRVEGIPYVLDDVVMRCLATDAAARFPSAVELAAALEATGLAATWSPHRDAGGHSSSSLPVVNDSPTMRTSRPSPPNA